MRSALKPGTKLDDMNRVTIREIAEALDKVEPANGLLHRISLYTWLLDAIALATTRAVYSPMNPFEDKSVADALWCVVLRTNTEAFLSNPREQPRFTERS